MLSKVKLMTDTEGIDVQVSKFSKKQLISSERYKNRRDLLSALLKDGELYSLEMVDKMIDNFMKGRVI